MRWMEEAKAQLGEEEIAGPKHNPEIVSYFADSKNAGIETDEVAWCAAFTGAVLERCGIQSTRSLMARSYEDFGQPIPIDKPRYGAIAVLSRTNDPRFGHVGFVTGWTDRHIELLGGNQSDAVSVARFDRGRVVALRWPGPAKTPQEVAREGSRTASEAKKAQVDAGAAGAGAAAAGAGAAAGDGKGDQPPLPEAEQLKQTQDYVGVLQDVSESVSDFAVFVAGKWMYLAAAVAVFLAVRLAWRARKMSWFRAEDESTGAHTGRQASPPAAMADPDEFTGRER